MNDKKHNIPETHRSCFFFLLLRYVGGIFFLFFLSSSLETELQPVFKSICSETTMVFRYSRTPLRGETVEEEDFFIFIFIFYNPTWPEHGPFVRDSCCQDGQGGESNIKSTAK